MFAVIGDVKIKQVQIFNCLGRVRDDEKWDTNPEARRNKKKKKKKLSKILKHKKTPLETSLYLLYNV